MKASSTAPSEPLFKRPPKGHRQKGAGTIVKSPPPVVTSEGIFLQPHQRLPSVILNEYCQKEKRLRPKYERIERGIMKVLLEDGKNSKHDLSFCPVQAADSDNLGKEFAALLALYHFQSSLPLERKLPEPFAATWLSIIDSNKAAKATEKDSKKAVPVKSSGKVASSERTESDTDKDPKKSNPTVTNKSEKSSIKPPVTTKDSSVLVKPAPPPAIIGLSNKSQFVSTASEQQTLLTVKAVNTRDRTYLHALELANKPMLVFMSPSLRETIENVVGVSHSENGRHNIYTDTDPAAIPAQLEGVVAQQLAELFIDRFGSAEEIDLVGADIRATFSEVMRVIPEIFLQLETSGFSRVDVAASMQHIFLSCVSSNDVIASVIDDKRILAYEQFHMRMTEVLASDHNWFKELVNSTLQSCLEHLCLTIPDSLLPENFNSVKHSGQYSTISVVSQGSSTQINQRVELLLSTESDETLLQSINQIDLIRKLMQFGWSNNDCRLALYIVCKQLGNICSPEELFENALIRLWKATSSGAGFNLPTAAADTDDICGPLMNPIVAEEIEVLSAIYSDEIMRIIHGSSGSITLSIALDSKLFKMFSKTISQISLFCFIPADSKYPHECLLPLLCVEFAEDAKYSDGDEILLDLQSKLLLKIIEIIDSGDTSSVFQLKSYLDELFDGDKKLISSKNKLSDSIAEQLLNSYSVTISPEISLSLPIHKSVSKSSMIPIENTTSLSKIAGKKQSKAFAPRNSFWSSSDKSLVIGNGLKESVKKSSSKYLMMLEGRKLLPAWGRQEEFNKMFFSNLAVVICGETGSGKSTQIPSFLLDYYSNIKVLMCQPRRIAAVGVATRIADERDSQIGEEIGYAVRGSSSMSPNTRLLCVTYGVLLKHLQTDPELLGIDAVILDEIHERGIESDFALSLLCRSVARRLLNNSDRVLKIIVMSATISREKFSLYLSGTINKLVSEFRGSFSPSLFINDAYLSSETPILEVEGRMYPVENYFLEDFDPLVRQVILHDDDSCSRYWRGAINYDLIVKLIFALHTGACVSAGEMLKLCDGTILVFLPGIAEISKLIDKLQSLLTGHMNRSGSRTKIALLALHGSLSNQEQQAVFRKSKDNEIKVVVSTNVAEASITIPNVTVVIDSCLVKEANYDINTQVSSLDVRFASKDSLRQRKGRAGRVKPGRCFKLVSRSKFESFEQSNVPEILRTSLDLLVLQIKAMNSEERDSPQLSCGDVLNNCIDSPSSEAVLLSEFYLQRLDALDSKFNITALGRHLSKLPCDPKIGKILIYGYLLNCLAPSSAIAAVLSSRDPFVTSTEPEIKETVNSARARFASVSGEKSDLLVIAELTRQYHELKDSGARRRFCLSNGINLERMQELVLLQKELIDGLYDIGFLDTKKYDFESFKSDFSSAREELNLVLSSLLSGLYPNIAKVLRPPARFVETVGGNYEIKNELNEFQFYVQASSYHMSGISVTAVKDASVSNASVEGLQRVFLAPNSTVSQTSDFSSNYILFEQKALAKGASNILVKNLSEAPAYAILFFGGSIVADYLNGFATVDGWIKFSVPGKIISLIQTLRKSLDELLLKKINLPELDLTSSEVLTATIALLSSDGIDKKSV